MQRYQNTKGKISGLKSPTTDALQKALNYEFDEKKTYSKKLLEAGVEIAKSLKNISRYYFEAKPQRAVRLREFTGAIIPTADSYNDIADKMAKVGLRVVRSDSQVDAVKQFEDVFFQSAFAGMR